MPSSSCPICDLLLPSQELERHVNHHFEEEELARDMELAQQIALAPLSPPPVVASSFVNIASIRSVPWDDQSNDGNAPEIVYGEAPESSTSSSSSKTSDHQKGLIEEKISCLVYLQIRSTFYKVEDGLMILLRKCLESESKNSVSILSGYVDHYQSIESEDVGWGCGWRNVQMLSSHLLMQRQEVREVLFGGSGFVPDIPSLQRWLEIAWEREFDILGADQFNHKVYGSTKWIGTTECATLFRSFGLRARIVDFGSKENESKSLSVHAANMETRTMQINGRERRKSVQAYGPMDKFLCGRHQGVSQEGIAGHDKSRYSSVNIPDNSATSKRHHGLVDWVWSYFDDYRFKRSVNSEHVIVSDRMPLYFQHDGHSRTIVGIQAQQQRLGMTNQYTLLTLDPSHRTAALERSLKENSGWQKLIKRGVHTLKQPQYQLCYVDPGIARGKEMEQLKTLDSIFFEF